MNPSTLNHAIRHMELLGLDLARMAGTSDPVANGLLDDAAEHHARIADLLARVKDAAGKPMAPEVRCWTTHEQGVCGLAKGHEGECVFTQQDVRAALPNVLADFMRGSPDALLARLAGQADTHTCRACCHTGPAHSRCPECGSVCYDAEPDRLKGAKRP